MADTSKPSRRPGPPSDEEERPPTVTFRVVCHGLDPQRVTDATGIAPSGMGDGGPYGGQIIIGVRAPTGVWDLEAPAPADAPLDGRLRGLLDRLEPHAATLHALPDCRLVILVIATIDRPFSSWAEDLAAETLGRIAALGASLTLDVTCTTCY